MICLYFKKLKNRDPYGVVLSPAEQKVLDAEMQRQYAEYMKSHEEDVDAIVLYNLHQTFGFGKDRLYKFWLALCRNYKHLTGEYEMPDDYAFLCKKSLKSIGVDLDEWSEELKKNLQ